MNAFNLCNSVGPAKLINDIKELIEKL